MCKSLGKPQFLRNIKAWEYIGHRGQLFIRQLRMHAFAIVSVVLSIFSLVTGVAGFYFGKTNFLDEADRFLVSLIKLEHAAQSYDRTPRIQPLFSTYDGDSLKGQYTVNVRELEDEVLRFRIFRQFEENESSFDKPYQYAVIIDTRRVFIDDIAFGDQASYVDIEIPLIKTTEDSVVYLLVFALRPDDQFNPRISQFGQFAETSNHLAEFSSKLRGRMDKDEVLSLVRLLVER